MLPRYTVYTKHRNRKRASASFRADDIERAKLVARNERNSWWGQNGIYEWIRVKDTTTGKYVYEA